MEIVRHSPHNSSEDYCHKAGPVSLVLGHFCKPGHQGYHDYPAAQSEEAAKETPQEGH